MFVVGIEFLDDYEKVLLIASTQPILYWPVLFLIISLTVFFILRQQVRDNALPEGIFNTKYLLVTTFLYTVYILLFDAFIFYLID